MSRYQSNYIITLNIQIDDKKCSIGVLDTQFKRIIKTNNDNIFSYDYDLSLQDIPCDSIETVCDYIGDLFNNINNYKKIDNDYLHFLKFLDDHVLPFCVDTHAIKKYLDVVKISELVVPSEMKSPEHHYVPGSNIGSRLPLSATLVKCNYIPAGNLSDVGRIYNYIAHGLYENVSEIKWFRSIACLIDYFGINHIVELSMKKDTTVSTIEGIYNPTSQELTISDSNLTLSMSDRINFRFDEQLKTNRIVFLMLKRLIELDPKFNIHPAIKMVNNIVNLKNGTSYSSK